MDGLTNRALKTLKRLSTFDPKAIPREMGQPRARYLAEELPGYIQSMKQLLAEAEAEQKRRKAAAAPAALRQKG